MLFFGNEILFIILLGAIVLLVIIPPLHDNQKLFIYALFQSEKVPLCV
jgi:hypothetical protein